MFTIRVRPRLKFTITEAGIAIGAPGLSAYEVWLALGNEGTEQDYLDSLKGEKGDAWTIGAGDKSSATDAGAFGDVSLGDDYLYICTTAGTAGNAVWKKTPLFKAT